MRSPQPKHGAYDAINAELAKATEERPKAAQPDTVSSALLPSLRVEMPKAGDRPLEPKFDLTVNNAPAAQVFMGIVSGTRYSMLVHPEVAGAISVNLKDVTVLEALEAIRELYGYEYKLDGPRIFIQPLTLQTRMFQVNYLTGQRAGASKSASRLPPPSGRRARRRRPPPQPDPGEQGRSWHSAPGSPLPHPRISGTS